MACFVDQQSDPALWTQLGEVISKSGLPLQASVPMQQSFYQPMQTRPPGLAAQGPFLDLAWSSISLHWLSESQFESPDVLLSTDLPEGSPGRLRTAATANADWSAFLRARAGELVPGGFLILAIPARYQSAWPPPRHRSDDDPDREIPGRYAAMRSPPPVHPEYWTSRLVEVKRALEREGVITAAECARITVPWHLRTPKELLRPLLADEEVTSSYTVERYTFHLQPCSVLAAHARGVLTQAQAASRFTDQIRGFFSSTLEAVLAGGPGGAARCETFWARVRSDFEAKLPLHGMGLSSHQLVLRRL